MSTKQNKKSKNNMKLLHRQNPNNQSVANVIPDAISYSASIKSHTLRYAITEEINRVKNTYKWLQNRTLRQWVYFGSSVFGVLLVSGVVLTAMFLAPRNHIYSYSGENCFFNPVALPNTVNPSNTETYSTVLRPSISVGNTPLLSTTTCLEISKIPEPQSVDTINLMPPLPLQKTITLIPETLPVITPYTDGSELVSIDAVMLYSLDQPDDTFSYMIQINDKESECVLHDKTLGCPLKNLELMQGVSYEYKMFRILGINSSEVMKSKLATLDPVNITSSSVSQDEMIYDITKSFSLTTNKNIESITGISVTESDSNKSYPVNLEFNESNITLSLTEELPRNSNFTITIQKIESTDGSYLALPYSVSFKTSAGPQVQGVNIGSYKVSPSASITLTFDIELDPNQEFSEYISISNENGQVSAAVSSRNNTVTIKPTNTIGACNSFTVTLKDGIKNKFGVSGNSSWSTKSRTLCQQVFSIGKSVQGRSITAYKFGSGTTKILFVGGMHGDEKSSVRTLDSFVENLEQNFPNIPADKTVVVIPNTNPDGYSASSRTNSNNVDLNRNYPTFDWTSGIYLPGNVFLEVGGGSNALSEPESVALANYTTSIRPRVVLTIHAKGRAVFANDAGDSKSIADVYASKSGFASYSNGDSDIFFSYPTTGEYEDWIREELNLPALLVELATNSSNEFNRQKSALWSMLSL